MLKFFYGEEDRDVARDALREVSNKYNHGGCEVCGHRMYRPYGWLNLLASYGHTVVEGRDVLPSGAHDILQKFGELTTDHEAARYLM